MGMGSMMGRAAGVCAGYSDPGYTTSAMGRGAGFGRGRGMGGGFGFRAGLGRRGVMPGFAAAQAPLDPAVIREQELEVLKSQAKGAQSALQSIEQRISELEAESETKS